MRLRNIHVKNEYSRHGLAEGTPMRHTQDMNIDTIRKLRGLNQEQLADMAGISQGHVSRAEKGEDGVTLGKLKAIAAALRVPLEDLFHDRSRTEAEIVQMYRRLPAEQRAVWLELSRTFASSQPQAPQERP
jgi:transcriptional regulator with XRE-family HTH domain